MKEACFIEGYESSDYIHTKIQENGYDYPCVIYSDKRPIGYIQCSDVYAYRTLCPVPKGLFTNEKLGVFCMDLFIAEIDYLNKGYGTEIVKQFSQKVFNDFQAKKILIDPASTNKRAIRCYEKAGFEFVKLAHDGVTECYIMQLISEHIEL